MSAVAAIFGMISLMNFGDISENIVFGLSLVHICNAACDRFMDKMSSLTGVFHNEAMSFDRETGKPKHFQAGSLYFKGDVYKRQSQWIVDDAAG